ncbi:hypothetical protein [Vreelandella sp. TE19]
MKTRQAFLPRKTLALSKPLVRSFLAFFITYSAAVNAQAQSRVEQYAKTSQAPVYKENYSIIRQNGHHNRTAVTQSYSAQYQHGNFSNIRQTGNFNTASITQAGGNNAGVILQNGDRHLATINQSYGVQGLQAFVSQTGHQSDIEISQSGSGYRSVSVEQQAFSGNARPVIVETY